MRPAVVAGCAVLSLAGCGGQPRRHPAGRHPSALTRAEVVHEYRSRPAPIQRSAGGSASPAAAVTAFARAYINWDAETAPRVMLALAARSVGQARAAMQLAAAQTAGDYELKRGGIANHGVVEAVARLPSRREGYVVVTKEMTTASASTAYQGLQPAWHVVIATVTQNGTGGWVVSGWEPQS